MVELPRPVAHLRRRRRSVLGAAALAWCALAAGAVLPSSCANTGVTFDTSSSSSSAGGGATGGSGGAGGASTSTTSSSGATGGAGGAGGGPTPGTVRVLTNHNDNAHTGANLAETKLTTSNVDVDHFGRLFARPVDDQIYAQPLYVPNVVVPGKGQHNVVYVATMNDSLYAFDADDPAQNTPLWQVSFLDPAHGVVPVSHADVGGACGDYEDISGNIGILSTPVIDEASKTIYVVAKTKDNGGNQAYRLHALDITTGVERAGSPVAISASAPGTGGGSKGGTITFDPVSANQRCALTLANGLVYIAFASYCDTGPYHGWVLAYDAATLAQKAVYNDTPNGEEGGIWMSGQGPSADDDGNVYLISGNGDFDGNMPGGKNFGLSFLKLSPTLSVLDWFTPYNFAALNAGDLDLGSSGALLVPGTNLVVGGGKNGFVYVLDKANLGHWNAQSDAQIVQSFQATTAHVHGSVITWNIPGSQQIYVWGEDGYLESYRLQNGKFQPVGQSVMPAPDGMPGGMLSLSGNGVTPGTGIVWATHPLSGNANQAVRPGILQAFDASDVTHLLWDTQQNPARDDFGDFAKFCPPTVADGKVFLATFSGQLVVYGHGDFSGPCYNGVLDPGEAYVDCGGACGPCVEKQTTCAAPQAMSVGDTYTCDLAATRTITSVGLSVGCNDAETGSFTLTFDQPPAMTVNAACNTSFMVNDVASRHVTLGMVSGGGADTHISVQGLTVTHY